MVVVISSKSLCILSSIVHYKTSSGARPALPMVVAPEAIVEKLISSIGSSILYPPATFSLELFNDNIVGCALSAPDGSSPRGYSRIFSGIDSKTDLFTVGI
jgi:hypothetical protein